MSTFQILSLLTFGNEAMVVDIAEGGSTAPTTGAFLHAVPPNGGKNQLWTAVVAGPLYPGFFLLQSLQPSSSGETLVIDIHGVTKAVDKAGITDGTLLDAYRQDPGWYENQLWAVGLSPTARPNVSVPSVPQRDGIVIQSYLTDGNGTPYVIDIQGWPVKKLTGRVPLDAFRQKQTSNENQLWNIAQQQELRLAPKITNFLVSDINLSSSFLDSVVTVTGTGFYPGTTLVLSVGFNNGIFTQPEPILGVADFAGNCAVHAFLSTWGLSRDSGTFSVGLAYNSVGTQDIIASASAKWDGLGSFSDFTNS